MLKMQSSARRKAYITAMKLLMGVAAVLTCALVVGMIGYILGNGIPNVTWEMLSTAPSYLASRVGILPDILSTLYIVIATLLIVLPLGVGAAIYLNEYAANKKLVSVIEYASETLSGIPSIIYGLVGMLIFCKNGTSLLAGALTLTIMNLPTIMRTTQESLKTVPQSYREGAFGLGAGKWRTIRTVVLPSCVDGIVTGCILSIGRILGESAALLFTAGSAHMLYNFFEGMHNAGATLTVALYFYAKESSDTGVVFAIAAILMLPILSSYGVETVPLPTAILSTHTADGFGSYVMRDMTDEMKAFAAHWRQLQIKFDGICMGFFGSVEQMHFAKDFLRDFAGEDTIVVVDPVLGDNGALYGCFTEEYVQAMRALCESAQLITPNRTEAALLAGCGMDAPIETLLKALTVENVIITGVHRGEEIGYCARLNGQYMEIFKPCLPQTLHGTGDVFVSALCGELMNGKGMPQALKDAAEFCDDCVQKTAKRGESHWYGLAFEDKLKEGRGL